MQRLTILLVTLFTTFFAFSGLLVLPVNAAQGGISGDSISICSFIKPICDAIGITNLSGTEAGSQAQRFLFSRINLAISLVFIGIILLSVFIIIKSGVTYIQSQGDPGKIEEATKAIKSVFFGIGLLFIGIVLLLIVLVVFNGLGLFGNALDNNDGQVCRLTDGVLVCTSGGQ